MNIPAAPRYDYATNKAYEFLFRHVSMLPFNPLDYIIANKWAVSTYTHYADMLGCSVKEVAVCFRSKDGYTMHNGRNYCIAVNDTILSKERINFTLMHEIAHIYLNHFIDFEKTEFQNCLSAGEYGTLEKEANCFARNVLMPLAVIAETGLDSYKIERIFKVGFKAASTRRHFMAADNYWITEDNYRLSADKYRSFIRMYKHVRVCAACGALFIASGYYCASCSNGLMIGL